MSDATAHRCGDCRPPCSRAGEVGSDSMVVSRIPRPCAQCTDVATAALLSPSGSNAFLALKISYATRGCLLRPRTVRC